MYRSALEMEEEVQNRHEQMKQRMGYEYPEVRRKNFIKRLVKDKADKNLVSELPQWVIQEFEGGEKYNSESKVDC
jgi:hypothetical protein